MSKEIKELVLKIVDKAIEVSSTTETDVSVDYAGSCQYLSVRISEHGFRKENNYTYTESTYMNFESALKDLNRMYSEICKYEKV